MHLSLQDIKGIVWERYIQREAPLLLFYVNLDCYGRRLQEETGVGVLRQVYVYQKPKGTFYFSKEDYEANTTVLKQALQDMDRLRVWHVKGEQAQQQALSLVGKHSSWKELLRVYSDSLLFGTILPHRLLTVMEQYAPEHPFLQKFMALRSESTYPLLMEKELPRIWKECAKLLGVSEEEASALTPEEITQVIDGNLKHVPDLEQRAKGCVFWSGTPLIFSFDISLPRHFDLEQEMRSVQDVRGKPASLGKAKGRVRIINRMIPSPDFEQGDILVSINTNPSLLPLMKKAGAIVTDEGGIACHASIVSRELGIPCVVGTKIATAVFKEGDVVEVDAEKGSVRKVLVE